jgi:hypothetical protein
MDYSGDSESFEGSDRRDWVRIVWSGSTGNRPRNEEVLSSDMYVNARIPLDPLEPAWGIIEE